MVTETASASTSTPLSISCLTPDPNRTSLASRREEVCKKEAVGVADARGRSRRRGRREVVARYILAGEDSKKIKKKGFFFRRADPNNGCNKRGKKEKREVDLPDRAR